MLGVISVVGEAQAILALAKAKAGAIETVAKALAEKVSLSDIKVCLHL